MKEIYYLCEKKRSYRKKTKSHVTMKAFETLKSEGPRNAHNVIDESGCKNKLRRFIIHCIPDAVGLGK